ncbi:MAG: chemotaxis protein CheW [Thermodesulfobacteriota bacterium]|nr:chemotaxis protein CheW [Thermodesulfobacteriota bacterium]
MNNSKEKAKVLKERARALAKEGVRVAEDESYLEVVEFMLAHERYALELTHIREVYPLKELTPLPGAPDFVLGIINVRGQILSIIDIKKFFELPEKGLTNLNQVIILESEEMEFGILADEILGTSSIPASTIQTSLPTLTDIREEYLKGVTGDRVVILDGEKILSDEKIVVQ